MKPAHKTIETIFLDEIDFSYAASLKKNINAEDFFGFPTKAIVQTELNLHDIQQRKVAYFSMEFGLTPSFYNTFKTKIPLNPINKKQDFTVFSNMRSMDYFHSVKLDSLVDLPIYSGGLGVLAGDTLKSVADSRFPFLGVGILWNKGYLLQKACYHFGQESAGFIWEPKHYPGLIPLKNRVELYIGKERVSLRLWKYYIFSQDRRHVVPLILLDSNVAENSPGGRTLTDRLYNSKSEWWRIVQRKILGVGGVRAIQSLGYKVDIYHLNEGHAAFAFVEIARREPADRWEEIKRRFAYTCHTPVAAGHDRLPVSELKYVLDNRELEISQQLGTEQGNSKAVNLTLLALNAAHKANAVSEKHEKVTKIQFPDHVKKIRGITNGIHHLTWVSDSMAELFDRYKKEFGAWREDPEQLRNILNLSSDKQFKTELWEAHQANKRDLVKWLSPWLLQENVFTIAWARRAASYKRPELILYDVKRLEEIARRVGPLQIIFAGKAHPKDMAGANSIKGILEKIDSLSGKRDYIKVLYLEDYDTHVGKKLVCGVDAWLNNPLPPFEASGTSGMKAILNGVPQLSTRDGWIAEAGENIGTIFGYVAEKGELGKETNFHIEEDARSLYTALDEMVQLYKEAVAGGESFLHGRWVNMMIHCIAGAGFFNTHRMVNSYNRFVWQLTPLP